MTMVAASVIASNPSPSNEGSALRRQKGAGIHLMNVAAIAIVALDLSDEGCPISKISAISMTAAQRQKQRLRLTPVLAVENFDCARVIIAISYQRLVV